SEVKTTSFATVAAPKFACGRCRVHFTLPVAASIAVRPPVAVPKFCAGTVSDVAEPTAHRFSHGTNTVPFAWAIGVSTPPKSPGQTVTGFFGSGPTSLRCLPTDGCQS